MVGERWVEGLMGAKVSFGKEFTNLVDNFLKQTHPPIWIIEIMVNLYKYLFLLIIIILDTW